MSTPQPWPKTGSRLLGDYRIFNLRAETKISPRTGQEMEFFVIDSTNWVNVIALTEDNQLILVEQFRHGSGTVELEIPGGMIDAGELSPLKAGLRELREETGFEGTQAEIIGTVFPNPAIMSNTCSTVLVRNCVRRHEVKLDAGEDLVTRLVPVADYPRLISSGKIKHSLVIVALYHYDLWQRQQNDRL